jgi:hypothetical protein
MRYTQIEDVEQGTEESIIGAREEKVTGSRTTLHNEFTVCTFD